MRLTSLGSCRTGDLSFRDTEVEVYLVFIQIAALIEFLGGICHWAMTAVGGEASELLGTLACREI